MTPETPPPAAQSSQRPPTDEVLAWASTALSSARALRTALNRMTIDHYRELDPAQQAELTGIRRQSTTTVVVLSTLTRQLGRQLRQDTGAPPADPWSDADAAEANADIEYDTWKNAF